MMYTRRLLLALACTVALLPLAVAGERKADKGSAARYFTGQVVPLAEVVAAAGGRLDPDAAATLVLRGDGGKVYVLVKDAGSRLFFKDKALLGRPMRLTGRLLAGSPILQVSAVHSIVKGELCEVYYWCDICSIRRGEKNPCECCGGPMTLREEPLKK